jgi:hypothetical protein
VVLLGFASCKVITNVGSYGLGCCGNAGKGVSEMCKQRGSDTLLAHEAEFKSHLRKVLDRHRTIVL